MSIRAPRTTRITKEQTPAPVATPTPVAPVVAVAKQPAVQEPVAVETQQKKASVISSSRIRKSLDKYGVNKAIEEEVEKLANLVHPYKKDKFIVSGKVQFARKDEERVAPTNEEIAEAKKRLDARTDKEKEADIKTELLVAEKVRFSKDAATALGHVLDRLVQAIANKIHEIGKEDNLKLIKSSILHDDRMKSVAGFCALTSLPSYLAREKEEQAARIKAARDQAYAEALAHYRTLIKECSSKVKAALKPTNLSPHVSRSVSTIFEETKTNLMAKTISETPAAAQDAGAEISQEGESFDFYVASIFKDVIKTDFRVTTDVKQYVGSLVSEFVARVAQFLNVQVECGQIKTVSKAAVLDATKLLMSSAAEVQSSVSVEYSDVPDPDALAEARKKRSDAKKAGGKFDFDVNTLPKKKQLTVVKTVDYVTCGWDELNEY